MTHRVERHTPLQRPLHTRLLHDGMHEEQGNPEIYGLTVWSTYHTESSKSGSEMPDLHRVHEKNYNTVYVATTLANNVGF